MNVNPSLNINPHSNIDAFNVELTKVLKNNNLKGIGVTNLQNFINNNIKLIENQKANPANSKLHENLVQLLDRVKKEFPTDEGKILANLIINTANTVLKLPGGALPSEIKFSIISQSLPKRKNPYQSVEDPGSLQAISLASGEFRELALLAKKV
jgi:hypothetical protein